MRRVLLIGTLSACLAIVTTVHAREQDSPLQDWIEQCDPDGAQDAINACAIVESAKARKLLDRVVDEISDTYAELGNSKAIAALPAVQDGWKTQMQADIDARFPLVDGEHPSISWGSSYVMQLEMLRAAIIRQRIAFLCSTWLPEQVRRHDPPSACASTDVNASADRSSD